MPVTTDPVLDPQAVLGAVLFRAGGLAVTRGEVQRWAERFDPSVQARADRRASLAALPFEDEAFDAEVESVAAEFRYARELESAESLTAWLGARGLSLDAWWEALRRDVLERRDAEARLPDMDSAVGEPSEHAPEGGSVEDEEFDAAARIAELVVTDLLAPAVEALAGRCAVALEAALTLPADMDARHDALEREWTAWRKTILGESQLRSALDRERLSWLVLELVRSRWSSPDAAREAIACVRDDGMTLEEIASDAGARADVSTVLLSDVPAALHDALLTAAPGELVGPIEAPAHWEVVLVRAKRAPSLAEPLVRIAAERDVVARAAAPLVAQHVSWVEVRT